MFDPIPDDVYTYADIAGATQIYGGNWEYSMPSTRVLTSARNSCVVYPSTSPLSAVSELANRQKSSRDSSCSVVIPCLVLASINAWNLWKEHWIHWEHMPPLEERVEYPYQNLRTRNYFWGNGDKVSLLLHFGMGLGTVFRHEGSAMRMNTSRGWCVIGCMDGC